MLWKVFPGKILYYAGILSFPIFSSSHQMAQFDRLYKKSLNQAFGLSKTTADLNLFSHVLAPTSKQFLQITLSGVASRTLERYSPQISQHKLLQILADIGEEMVCDITTPSHKLKLHYTITNIQDFSQTTPPRPLSWTRVRTKEALKTLKFAISVDRKSRLTTFPFCRTNNPTSGHFFNCCPSLPDQLQKILNRINQFCDDHVDGYEPLLDPPPC